jgi:hypothetical protein
MEMSAEECVQQDNTGNPQIIHAKPVCPLVLTALEQEQINVILVQVDSI